MRLSEVLFRRFIYMYPSIILLQVTTKCILIAALNGVKTMQKRYKNDTK